MFRLANGSGGVPEVAGHDLREPGGGDQGHRPGAASGGRGLCRFCRGEAGAGGDLAGSWERGDGGMGGDGGVLAGKAGGGGLV